MHLFINQKILLTFYTSCKNNAQKTYKLFFDINRYLQDNLYLETQISINTSLSV